MTAVGESDSSLAAKCLDLCQALAGQGMAFNFSLSIGSTFSFSLDARGRGQALANQGKTKKKKTPSTMRRNARRRTEFLKKKLEDSGEPKGPTCGSAQGPRKEDSGGLFKCDQCEKDFKSENGLKIHVGKTHNKVDSDLATPEVARHQLTSSVSLSASPLLNTSREESPIHQLVNADSSAVSSTPVKENISGSAIDKCVVRCGNCGQRCPNKEALRMHVRAKHRHPWKCFDCDTLHFNSDTLVNCTHGN